MMKPQKAIQSHLNLYHYHHVKLHKMANQSFGFNTTSEEVTSYHSSQIVNKTILVTGVSPGGLGLQTALALAPHSPALLILAARSAASLATAKKEIAAVTPNVPVKLLTLDLSNFRAVRTAAAEVNGWSDVNGIDILVNNAGVMSTPWALSEDGVESQFATNHLGPWLFTNLIMDRIVQAKGRVVIVSSVGHMYGDVRFEDWNFEVCSLLTRLDCCKLTEGFRMENYTIQMSLMDKVKPQMRSMRFQSLPNWVQRA